MVLLKCPNGLILNVIENLPNLLLTSLMLVALLYTEYCITFHYILKLLRCESGPLLGGYRAFAPLPYLNYLIMKVSHPNCCSSPSQWTNKDESATNALEFEKRYRKDISKVLTLKCAFAHLVSTYIKGTVARDCRPLVFFNNRPHMGPWFTP